MINNCLRKDIKAWDLFYRKYKTFVLKCVKYKISKYAIKPSAFSGEDITHEIFHQIWKHNKLGTIKNPDYVKTWLSIFSINYTSNYLRRELQIKRTEVSLDAPLNNDKQTTLKDLIPDKKVDTIGDIDSKELYAFIIRNIDALPKRQKIVFKLNVLHKKKHIEISRMMNLPLPTVSSLIFRSRNKIKKKVLLYFQTDRNDKKLHENR